MCGSMVDIQSQTGCVPYFHTWCGLSARIYDACLKRLARGSLKYRTQKIAKIPHLGTIAQICSVRLFGAPRRISIGNVTARHSSSGRQPNFAVLNRGRHLYSAGRSSRWALAYILASHVFTAHAQKLLF